MLGGWNIGFWKTTKKFHQIHSLAVHKFKIFYLFIYLHHILHHLHICKVEVCHSHIHAKTTIVATPSSWQFTFGFLLECKTFGLDKAPPTFSGTSSDHTKTLGLDITILQVTPHSRQSLLYGQFSYTELELSRMNWLMPKLHMHLSPLTSWLPSFILLPVDLSQILVNNPDWQNLWDRTLLFQTTYLATFSKLIVLSSSMWEL